MRLLAAALLLAFLLLLVCALWWDLRATLWAMNYQRQIRGYLLMLNKLGQDYLPTQQVFPLLPLTSIGRSPSNTIIIDQHYASGEHALIALRSGQWWLEDRNSRNGTLLNGDLVTQPTILSEGDIISIGDVHLQFTLEK
ncbi:MAG: FHA domain-containing protein [Anaerolineae bacterium]|nr:FHA domain-containing protein [Anaerolineae bacterium]MDW8173178.1 FHA domain-containing protein [Anaerolineae bacterium]